MISRIPTKVGPIDGGVDIGPDPIVKPSLTGNPVSTGPVTRPPGNPLPVGGGIPTATPPALPPPSQITSPVNPPGNATRGTSLAVIVMVDSANSPQFCTIAVADKSPFESGYLLPVGCGPFAAGGTSGFQYYYNNSNGVGGSIVVVDLDARKVLSFTGSNSTTPPTPFYKAIQDHTHSGNLNPDGFNNPNPVNLSSGESQNQLPYTQNSSAIQGAIDSSSNLLASDFPGQTVHQTTGAYAGWELMTTTKTVGGGTALSCNDTHGAPLSTSPMLWAEWTAVTPSTSLGYGPCWYDANGTGFISADFYGGGGAVFATQTSSQTSTSVGTLPTNTANNGLAHTFRMGIAYVSGTNPTASWHVIIYLDGAKVFDSNVIANFNNAQAYAGFRADQTATVYIRDFNWWVGGSALEMQPPIIQNIQYKNLLSNGNFIQNGAYVTPTSLGWKIYSTANSVAGNVGTYTLNGMNYGCGRLTNNASGGAGLYQVVSGLKPGQKYSYCVLNNSNGNPAWARVWIGTPGITTGYNQPASQAEDPLPNGTPGSFYSAATYIVGGWLNGSNQGAFGTWNLLAGTFTVPNGVTQIGFLLQGSATSAGIANHYWLGAMLWEGDKYQDYVDGETQLGFAPGSTFLNRVIPAVQNYIAPAVTFSCNSTGTSMTASVATQTINFADGSTLVVSPSSTSTRTITTVNGSTYYWGIYADPGTGAVTFNSYGTSAPTSSQQLAVVSDGQLPINTNISATASSNYSGGGTLGGGGKVGGCPSVDQLIETQERGFVQAGTLQVGEHLRDPEDMGWNVIQDVSLMPDLIMEVCTDLDDPVKVNYTHRFMDLNGNWIYLQYLAPGSQIKGSNGIDVLTITSISCLGPGTYTSILCDRNRYLLGKAYGHNISY